MSGKLPPHLEDSPVGVRKIRVRLVCWVCSALQQAKHELDPKGGFWVWCDKGNTRKSRARFLRVHRRCGFL